MTQPATAPQPVAPADIPAMTTQLVALTEQLTNLLSQETELVRVMRIPEIAPLQPEKVRLTALYQQTFKALSAAGEGKTLPAPLKERLATAGERLAKAVIANELALRVGKIATERLIGSIVNAVREQKKAVTSYAPQRKLPHYGFMTAAAVDRHL